MRYQTRRKCLLNIKQCIGRLINVIENKKVMSLGNLGDKLSPNSSAFYFKKAIYTYCIIYCVSEKSLIPTNTSAIHKPFTPSAPHKKSTPQPIEVIKKVFDPASLSDLTDYLLSNWLRVAVINTQSPYSDGNGREILYEFYEQLIAFITQLHLASENQQLTNLLNPVTDFFHQYPIDYLQRELADFLEAGIGHNGEFPNGFTPWQAWMAYNHIICLVETAYRLYTDKPIQCVLNTPNQQPFLVADAHKASLVSMPTGFASSATRSINC